MLILLALRKGKEKKRKRKVEGPVWKPSNISFINTILQWNRGGRKKFYKHGGRQKMRENILWAKKIWRKQKKKPKTLSPTTATL
jgi:hypothetical protein